MPKIRSLVVLIGVLALLLVHAHSQRIAPAMVAQTGYSDVHTPTQTSVGIATGKKVVTPMQKIAPPTEIPVHPSVSRVKVSDEYIGMLDTIEAMGASTTDKSHWFEKYWLEDFYAKLDRLVESSPTAVKSEAQAASNSFKIGIELMDQGRIRQALREISSLRLRIE